MSHVGLVCFIFFINDLVLFPERDLERQESDRPVCMVWQQQIFTEPIGALFFFFFLANSQIVSVAGDKVNQSQHGFELPVYLQHMFGCM